MKPHLVSIAFFLLAGGLLAGVRAGESAPAACCAPEKPAIVAPCCPEEKPGQPLTDRSLYQLDATWVTDAGLPLRLTAFRGQPVLVAMFFASCEYACPVLVNDLQRVREQLPADVRAKTRILLVTFDLVRDTPAALKSFRERFGLDAAWTLVRSDTAGVQELAMLLGVKYKQDARGQFAHSNLLTLLNAEGEIVHQRSGLMGDVSETAKAVAKVAAAVEKR
jgi:protein SCO1/2